MPTLKDAVVWMHKHWEKGIDPITGEIMFKCRKCDFQTPLSTKLENLGKHIFIWHCEKRGY